MDSGPDLLQRYPGIEQSLDHLEEEDVTEAIQPFLTALKAGADQADTVPTVELPAGDADGCARDRRKVASFRLVSGKLPAYAGG